MRVAIIGAGISGLACAEVLVAQGLQVRLFDKGRGPGGRMATRRTETPAGEVSFDHGAQFFTVRDPVFAACVRGWARQGLVAQWPEASHCAGSDAWVGVPGMNALPRAIAQGHDIAQGALVRGLARAACGGWRIILEHGSDGPFDAVVVALPAEQAAGLLGLCDLDMARLAVESPSEPCWAAMLAFCAPVAAPSVIENTGPIRWAARNSAKPGRSGPEAWIVHATTEWTRANLEQPADRVAEALSSALGTAAGAALPGTLSAVAHRWRYARSGNAGRGFAWSSKQRLGACGDWLAGPRIEAAWLSGHQLGEAIARQASVPMIPPVAIVR